jgi:hypothetical protein
MSELTAASLKSTFDRLDTRILLDLQSCIEEIIVSRISEDTAAFWYDTLRRSLAMRFRLDQIEGLRPWRVRSKASQAKFKASWSRALGEMKRLGFEEGENLNRLIADLVRCNPRIPKHHLTMEHITDSLDRIVELLDYEFPSYRNNPGVFEVLKQLTNA